jgi:hypothetical protein
MIDARDPLEMGEGAAATEFEAYAQSWQSPGPVKAPSRKSGS